MALAFETCAVIDTVKLFRRLVYSLCLNFAAKVSQEVNRKLPDRNMMIQLLALYTDPVCDNAHRYRRTDTETDGWMDRRTDDIMTCAARSAKNEANIRHTSWTVQQQVQQQKFVSNGSKIQCI